ncbi:hypothetical protein D7316_00951 [Gordonia insulae]|uniref:Uncharacterized protein n=2 Tax=Gordonia insulae TaxID=2420509 RepID=A0A3G8JH03_9ACTN|nr:hypothetical protein D7316_00951 [Gordonia insulae]
MLAAVITVGFAETRGSLAAPAEAVPATPPSSSQPIATGANSKECVGSDFATLGKIYDSIFDSFLPYLPPQVKKDKDKIKAQTHRDMDRLRISNMLVSNHPSQLGAQRGDAIMKYRDPISLYVVSQLLNVRHGKQFQAITVENLTLAQAVETVWLLIYTTVIIPLTVVLSAVPNIAPIWGPINVRFLITLPFYVGMYGARYLYQFISSALVNSCLVSMTKEERDRAGKPIKDLRFSGSVPKLIEDIAGQVDLADQKGCEPIGNQPMSRIVDRTTRYLTDTNKDPATRAAIAGIARDVENRMRNTWVPVNLIPADPADYNQIEGLISLLGGYVSPDIPITIGDNSFGIATGGAPLDIVIGLVHNITTGENMGKQVRLWDLPVTKSMTAAYYTMYFSIYVAQVVYANALPIALPGVANLVPRPFGLFYAPLNFGFNAYHNVLRSMCFAEDKKVEAAVA